MIKKLTRIGDSLALILDEQMLAQQGLDENTPLEIFTNGEVLVVTPSRGDDPERQQRLEDIMAELHARYGGVFKRLAD